MPQLHDWLKRQLDEKLTEPHSALGGAIRYLLIHWEKLTLFMRYAGAPLDNTVCERALKKAILHRKHAQFDKTPNGARVGDRFMSLIYTCQPGKWGAAGFLSAGESRVVAFRSMDSGCSFLCRHADHAARAIQWLSRLISTGRHCSTHRDHLSYRPATTAATETATKILVPNPY
jgi:hypothetical protein